MTTDINILEHIDRTKKVLVIGPIVVNETVTGQCKRIASDFPIPVFEDAVTSYDIGGPGNLVKNAKAMTLGVDLITMIGDTDRYVVDIMRAEGVDTSGVVMCPGYSVAKKIRYHSGGHMAFRMNEGNEDFVISKLVEEKIISTFNDMIGLVDYSVIALSDYRYGMLSDCVTSTIISISKSKGIPVIVDPPKFGSYDKFRGCMLLKPNLDEAKYYLGRAIDTEEDIKGACIDICEKMESSFAIITLADRGIALFDKENGRFDMCPAPRGVGVVDVNGAGDTVLAVVAFGIANKLNLRNTCGIANECAANVIQKPSTVAVNLIEVIHNRVGNNCLTLTNKREVKNLKHLLGAMVDISLVISSFFEVTTNHLKVLRKANNVGGIVIVGVAPIDDGSSSHLEFILEMLGSNKHVKYTVVLVDMDKDWLIGALDPTYFTHIEHDGGILNNIREI